MTTNGSLLLVDDDDMTVVALREHLVRRGCTVLCARDLDDARTLVTRQRPACVWIDLQLTGTATEKSLAFIAEVRRALPEAQIVALTAYAADDSEEQVHRAGANRLLHKPLSQLDAVLTRAFIDLECIDRGKEPAKEMVSP
ncbi:MAG TPA: response regulator [Thermoanaerobaculia bacterium]|nr:response regulator [Thermoanaerobaculia bacterium]